jgi:predicted RNA-binding Zn-ribbon protein involved in translation (DUF1610 family)
MAGAMSFPLTCGDTTISAVRSAPHREGVSRGRDVAYRYWCGECGFKTPWLSRSEGEQRQIEHYAKHHPAIDPGGQVEVDRKDRRGGRGRILLMGIVILLLLAALWRRW